MERIEKSRDEILIDLAYVYPYDYREARDCAIDEMEMKLKELQDEIFLGWMVEKGEI